MSNIYRDRIVLNTKYYIDRFNATLYYYHSLTNSVESVNLLENEMIEYYNNLVLLSNLFDCHRLPPIDYNNIDISKIIKEFLNYKSIFNEYTKRLKIKNTEF